MNGNNYIPESIVKRVLMLMVIFMIPTSLIAISNTSVNERANNSPSDLPLIKTGNSITLKNSKAVGELGNEKLIEIGSIHNKKLIKISGQFIKGEANVSYNPSAVIELTKWDDKNQGIAIAFMSKDNTGIYASRLMINDKLNRVKKDLGITIKEGEEFSVTIKILKPGEYNIQIGGESITKTIQSTLGMLYLRVFSAVLLINNIVVK